MKKQLATLALLAGLSALPAAAQTDEARMTKDLRVAAKVLESLIREEPQMIMYTDNIEGDYLDNFGVVFSIGSSYSIMAPGVKYLIAEKDGNITGIKVKADKSLKSKVQTDEQSDPDAGFLPQLEKTIIEFLTDYSQMISQLRPEDKILVTLSKPDYYYEFSYQNVRVSQEIHGLTVEMLKKDHLDYISGRLTREQLVSRIKINRENGTAIRAKDLDLFAAMLKTAFDRNYTETYFINRQPGYERLPGMGALFTFKVYSSFSEDGLFRIAALDKGGFTAAERNEWVKKVYPQFVADMKESLLNYGRTISSLQPGEKLILKITLTQCDGCGLPAKVQIGVDARVLADYNTGKLQLAEALENVTFREID